MTALTEFAALALGTASKLPLAADWLLVDLVVQLERAHRPNDALDHLRRIEPWLREAGLERFGSAVFVAEQLTSVAELAERLGDAAMAGRLRGEARTLLERTLRADVASARALALPALEVARRLELKWAIDWLGLSSNLSVDLARLEEAKRAGDPAWETQFELLEARLEADPEPSHHALASQALLRCGLTRAAQRHWARSNAHLDAALLVALWREGLAPAYAATVQLVRTRWVESPPRDWSWVGTAVDLALAQHQAGDVEGFLASAQVARGLALENTDKVLAAYSPWSPEVATWSLAHLLRLEVAAGDEAAAREVLARCHALIAAPIPKQVGKSWRGRSIRTTTALSLSKGCVLAGWFAEAMRATELAKRFTDVWSSVLQVVAASGSMELAQVALAKVADDPRRTLELALTVCQHAAV